MSKHTKEPWAQSHRKAKHREGYYTEVYDSAGETIATLAWYPVEEPGGVTSTSRSANAARIVACVNALEGIADPSAVKDAIEALRKIEALKPEEFDGFPADWSEQVAACSECQRYKGHPIQQGICDEHRRPFYERERHDAREAEAIGPRARIIARDALAKLGGAR